MKKQLLIICSTHGDEKIGQEAVRKLRTKRPDLSFDSLVANERAAAKNKRFLERDLNRSYPGNARDQLYERRRAAEIYALAQEYRYVIDMHEARCARDDFIIVPRRKMNSVFPLEHIALGTVLLWPEPKGPLGQFCKHAVELEFGMRGRDRKKVVERAAYILERFIQKLGEGKRRKGEAFANKSVFCVYGSLGRDQYHGDINRLRDFRPTTVRNETFCPLLVGQYLQDGIVCYKARQIL
jgi:succinylglutamate desuccinylase